MPRFKKRKVEETFEENVPEEQQKVARHDSRPISTEIVEYLAYLANNLPFEVDHEAKQSLIDNVVEECSAYDVVDLFCSETGDSIGRLCEPCTRLSILFSQRLLKQKRAQVARCACTPRGSRCLETILYNLATSGDEEQATSTSLIVEICEMAVAEFDTLSDDFGGSHVLRCLGRILNGLGKDDKNLNPMRRTVPIEFESCLNSLMSLVLNWNYMSDYLHRECVSHLVQEFVELDAKYGKSTNFGQWIENCFGDSVEKIRLQMESKQGSRVWEKMIVSCNEEQLERATKTFFVGNLSQMTLHGFANFVVQRLLERCKTEEMLADVFDELLPCFEQIWSEKKFGVVVSMSRAVVQTKCQQKKFLKVLLKQVGCKKSKRLHAVFALVQLREFHKDSEEIELDENKIQLHGSLLVQNLLNFKDPSIIVESVLHLTQAQLGQLICHNVASRIFDAFFASRTIVNEQKRVILSKLQDNLVKMACDRVGSRVLENIWNQVDVDEKFAMASALLKKETSMRKNHFGKILYDKYRLELLKRNKNQWRNNVKQYYKNNNNVS